MNAVIAARPRLGDEEYFQQQTTSLPLTPLSNLPADHQTSSPEFADFADFNNSGDQSEG